MKFYKKLSIILCYVLLSSFALVGCGEHKHNYVDWVCSCGATDPNRESAGLQYVELPDGTMEVSGFSGVSTPVYVPETKDGKTVTSIGERVFEGISTIKFIYLPKTIVTIKEEAFHACSALKLITIPENVKTIGYRAFADCGDVARIDFNATECDPMQPDNLIFYHVGANTDGVKMVIKNTVKIIPDYFLYNGTSDNRPFLRYVEFEDNSQCKEIGYAAFCYERDIVSVDFGENPSLEIIGRSAFNTCVSLRTLVIPSTVKVIRMRALYNLQSITSITVEDPNGWCARQFDGDANVIDYAEFSLEQMSNLMVLTQGEGLYGRDYYFSKIADGIPELD